MASAFVGALLMDAWQSVFSLFNIWELAKCTSVCLEWKKRIETMASLRLDGVRVRSGAVRFVASTLRRHVRGLILDESVGMNLLQAIVNHMPMLESLKADIELFERDVRRHIRIDGVSLATNELDLPPGIDVDANHSFINNAELPVLLPLRFQHNQLHTLVCTIGVSDSPCRADKRMLVQKVIDSIAELRALQELTFAVPRLPEDIPVSMQSLHHLPCLRKVTLQPCTRFNPSQLREITHIPSLRNFEHTAASGFSRWNRDIADWMRNPGAYEKWTRFATQSILRAQDTVALWCMTDLKELVLEECDFEDAPFLHAMPKLESVTFEFVPSIAPLLPYGRFFDQLASCQFMTTLSLMHRVPEEDWSFSCDEFGTFLRRLPLLTSLTVRGSMRRESDNNINNSSNRLEFLLHSVPKLQCLALHQMNPPLDATNLALLHDMKFLAKIVLQNSTEPMSEVQRALYQPGSPMMHALTFSSIDDVVSVKHT